MLDNHDIRGFYVHQVIQGCNDQYVQMHCLGGECEEETDPFREKDSVEDVDVHIVIDGFCFEVEWSLVMI